MPILKAGISMSSNCKFSAGAFTFVEVLMALAIVSISMLSLIKLHVISINMNDAAQMNAQAVFLAQEKISELLAEGYPNLGSYGGSVQKNGLDFDWRAEVENLQLARFDDRDIPGLREISVDVSWQRGNSVKQLQMSTCVANRKLK